MIQSKAVGAFAAEAMQVLKSVCEELRITNHVALMEAETELAKMQRLGDIDVILCNDSGYIRLGCKHVFLDDGHLWSGTEVRYWLGPERLDYPDPVILSHAAARQVSRFCAYYCCIWV